MILLYILLGLYVLELTVGMLITWYLRHTGSSGP